jgi:hypothetical protein
VLPPNFRDVTAEKVGTAIGITGATAAGKGEAGMTDDIDRSQDRARARLGAPFRRAGHSGVSAGAASAMALGGTTGPSRPWVESFDLLR